MANKIYEKHDLEKYNKKYGKKNLMTISKADFEKNPNVLDGHSWWKIDNNYYEITKFHPYKWFRGLKGGVQICSCILIGSALACSIAIPVTATVVANNTVATKVTQTKDPVSVNPLYDAVINLKKYKRDNGNLEFEMTTKADHTRVSDVKVICGEDELKLDEDYSFDFDSNTTTIFKSTVDKYKDKTISITPVISQGQVSIGRMPSQINVFYEEDESNEVTKVESVSKELIQIYEDFGGNLVDVTDQCTFDPELGSDLKDLEWENHKLKQQQKVSYLGETYSIDVCRAKKVVQEPTNPGAFNGWDQITKMAKMIESIDDNSKINDSNQVTVVGTIDGKEYVPSKIEYTKTSDESKYKLCELTLVQKDNPDEKLVLELSGGVLFNGNDQYDGIKYLYQTIISHGHIQKYNPSEKGEYESLKDCKVYGYYPSDDTINDANNYNFGVQEKDGTQIFDLNVDYYGRITQLKASKGYRFYKCFTKGTDENYQPFGEKEIDLKFYYNDYKPVKFEQKSYTCPVSSESEFPTGVIANLAFNYTKDDKVKYKDVDITVEDSDVLRAERISDTEVCLIGLNAGETTITVSIPGTSTGYTATVKVMSL